MMIYKTLPRNLITEKPEHHKTERAFRVCSLIRVVVYTKSSNDTEKCKHDILTCNII